MDSAPASKVTAVQSPGNQPSGSRRPGTRPWPRRGLAAAGHGVALTGLILAEAGMLVTLALAVTFAGLGFGLLLIPGLVLAGRRLASQTRRCPGRGAGCPSSGPTCRRAGPTAAARACGGGTAGC